MTEEEMKEDKIRLWRYREGMLDGKMNEHGFSVIQRNAIEFCCQFIQKLAVENDDTKRLLLNDCARRLHKYLEDYCVDHGWIIDFWEHDDKS